MTTEKFVKKTIVRIVVMILISVFAFSFMNASNAIISNYVALGQMENSDGMFIFMEIYNNAIRPIMVGILTAVIGYGVGMIVYDTYKFIKRKRNGEKENEKD
jgi:hypothetical protein